MTTKILGAFTLLLFCALGMSAVSSHAEDIKSRMEARLPALTELKAKGVVGEDNRGYLQFVGGHKEKEELVNAENSDRSTVYEAIAKQQGTTVEFVEKRRALQIAEKASTGEWLQDESGKWYQKK